MFVLEYKLKTSWWRMLISHWETYRYYQSRYSANIALNAIWRYRDIGKVRVRKVLKEEN